MFEELIPERRDDILSSSKQEELIKNYCAGIEEQIRTAPASAEAKKIIDVACSGFESECKSGVVRSFLQQYVRGLYENHWNNK